MEQKLYPSKTSPAPYDNDVVESIINKQLQKISSFKKIYSKNDDDDEIL